MNKTVTINISGIIFHIEEDAFDKLSKYLGTIKGFFSKTDGGNEIMADIEARIAEMLQSKTSAVKQVVLMADVDAVIDTMGRPEQFAEAESQNQAEEESSNTEQGEPVKRRMFRDPDHKAIGGVCSGIAAYFDVDIIWIRLAMFLLIFFGGVSLWVYIIMWIVIPEAKTTAEKLSMRGEKIDINNISKTVKEEAEQLKKRAQKYGNDIKNNSEGFKNDSRNFFDKLGAFITEFAMLLGKVFGRLVGAVLLVFGVCFMFMLIASIFGFSVAGTNAEFNDWINLIFLERNHYTLGMIGMILFFGIPIMGIIYGGIKLLFKIKYRNRWMNMSLGLVWMIGVTIMIYIGVTTGKEFSDGGKIKDQVQITQKDTLYLTVDRDSNLKNEWQINEEGHTKVRHRRNHTVVVSGSGGSYYIGKKGSESRIFGKAELNIVQATGDQFEMYIIKKARGEDRKAATERAKAIDYKFVQKDSLITFDELFMVASNEKFRVQEVQVLIKVPRGKVIYLDRTMYPFINDIENTTNTWDGDMIDRRWVMTKDGLACLDCQGLDLDDDEDDEDFPTPPTPPNQQIGRAHV